MKLSEKQLEVITKTAAVAALEHLEKEKQKQQKERYDRRLRNVKLLLRNYRSFAAHVAEIKMDINELDEKLELEELDLDEYAIRAIKKSKEKTLALVVFLNKMLKVYETMCEQSDNTEDIRKYATIYHLYISDDKKTYEQIAECHFTNVRTVYRDVADATKTISVLVFGVDGIRIIN